MNSVTVGSGGTYADWAAFLTALVAASPLSDDWDVLHNGDVSIGADELAAGGGGGGGGSGSGGGGISGAITAAMAAGY